MNKKQIYVGLMSGTSMDGIDAAVVEFSDDFPLGLKVLASDCYPYPQTLRSQVLELSTPKAKLKASLVPGSIDETDEADETDEIESYGELDARLGNHFADAAVQIIHQAGLIPDQICAIGSHGQTVRHRPKQKDPFTLQIGDPAQIAFKSGVRTVGHFRQMDIAAGGQGAPLTPAFNQSVFYSKNKSRCILNLGGIANVTLLPSDPSNPVIGFDTGPANGLLDAWYAECHPASQINYDKNGAFSSQGANNPAFLSHLLDDPYFDLAPPKSTGREYFSLDWLKRKIQSFQEHLANACIQRSLVEFTAHSIYQALRQVNFIPDELILCGGGRHNSILVRAIEKQLSCNVLSTDSLGISGDDLEAVTFAWLAKQRIEEKPSNLPAVTGAIRRISLGAIYLP